MPPKPTLDSRVAHAMESRQIGGRDARLAGTRGRMAIQCGQCGRLLAAHGSVRVLAVFIGAKREADRYGSHWPEHTTDPLPQVGAAR